MRIYINSCITSDVMAEHTQLTRVLMKHCVHLPNNPSSIKLGKGEGVSGGAVARLPGMGSVRLLEPAGQNRELRAVPAIPFVL